MKSLVDEYIYYLAVERGLAENTLISYRLDLIQHISYNLCLFTPPTQDGQGTVNHISQCGLVKILLPFPGSGKCHFKKSYA